MRRNRGLLALIVVFVALIFGATLVTTAYAQGQDHVSPCKLPHNKWADPSFLWLGEWTTVTLTSTTDCPALVIPLHIVLSIDGSLSMDPQNKLVNAKRASVRFVNEMDFDVTKVGVNRFGGDVQVMSPLTGEKGQVLSAINRIHTNWGTDMEGAMSLSHRMLSEARAENADPTLPPAIEAIVLLSDGAPWPLPNNPLRTAARAKGEGILIISVCVGSNCDQALMRNLASRPDLFFDVQQSGRLMGVYTDIAHQLMETDLRRLTIADEVPTNMKYVEGSASVPPDSWSDGVLKWNLNAVSTSGITLTYDLEPLEEGIWPTNVEASGKFWDTENRVGSYLFPVPTVEVRIPTPTPTLTPSPTYTPSPTPTITPTPTATNTPTPTPTPVPKPVYLPILLRERCVPKTVSTDVVIVLDTSTSMADRSREGVRSKREAGAQVARLFLQRLNLTRDQVSLVAFDDRAQVLNALGRDRAAMERSLSRLPGRIGTRIDAGLLTGLETVTGPGRNPLHTSVMLLVTDGVPTRSSAAAAVAAAKAVRDADVELFVVGVGDDANVTLLRRIAGRSNRFFERERVADLGPDLDSIYETVTSHEPCGGARYWSFR